MYTLWSSRMASTCRPVSFFVTVVARTNKGAVFQCGVADVVYGVVKTYLDLDVLGALKQYKGPVLLARRRRDEMISTQVVWFE